MPTHFLFYFRFNSFNVRLIQRRQRICRYAGSNQFSRVKPGDTLYIVTRRQDTKHLYLIARLIATDVLRRLEAAYWLSERPEQLWPADLYAVAQDSAAEPFKMIDLMPWVENLRFVSTPDRDHLQIVNGTVNPQQLQTMRHLEPASAALLDNIWQTGHDELASLSQTPF